MSATATPAEPFIVEFVNQAIKWSSSISLNSAIVDTARSLIPFAALRGTAELPTRSDSHLAPSPAPPAGLSGFAVRVHCLLRRCVPYISPGSEIMTHAEASSEGPHPAAAARFDPDALDGYFSVRPALVAARMAELSAASAAYGAPAQPAGRERA